MIFRIMENLAALFQTYQTPLVIIASVSFFLFIATPLLIPFVIRHMREDYFIRESEEGVIRTPGRKALYLLWHVVKNILGPLFIIAGIIMLFIPGQGILTIIIGLILLDFPGKHRLINRLARGENTRKALIWIRLKTRRPPFLFDGSEKTGGVE